MIGYWLQVLAITAGVLGFAALIVWYITGMKP